MKNKQLLCGILFLGMLSAQAQQKTSLSVKDAVTMALSNSSSVHLANAKVSTKNFELQSVKNNQYPDFKLSGQYLRLTNADVKLKSSEETSSDPNAETASSPSVNQLILGQANLTMPIFSGFKLRNTIKASENLYKSEQANAEFTAEQTAMQVIEYYAELYKVQKSIELLNESLKSSRQRVTDFTDMEQNGLIARNDLLKSQLQVSRIQLSLDEAEKNERVINYNLITLLKLPAGTQIGVTPDNISGDLFATPLKTEFEALENRKDLEAIALAEKASDYNVKAVKSSYFPSLSLIGGYTALDLQNVARVTNAVNFGVGVSYNVSSIFKNGKDVKAAKSRAEELHQQQAILTDRIKSQIVSAKENYELSIKQNQLYTEAVTQADENYRIVKDKYDNGLSNTNDLLEADVEDLTAKINVAYAQANMALKFYELLEASGTLTQSFNISK